jgi:hypothetical protein
MQRQVYSTGIRQYIDVPRLQGFHQFCSVTTGFALSISEPAGELLVKSDIALDIDIPSLFQSLLQEWKSQKIHIFVDASNTMWERDVVEAQRLFDAITNSRDVVRKVAVGSRSKGKNVLLEKLKQDANWEVTILERVNGHEQAVDDIIHAAMQSDILKDYGDKRTMIVLTGDGNANEGRTSFPVVIEQAIGKKLGEAWNIELWPRSSTSTASVYRQFVEMYPENFQLGFLRDLEANSTPTLATPSSGANASCNDSLNKGSVSSKSKNGQKNNLTLMKSRLPSLQSKKRLASVGKNVKKVTKNAKKHTAKSVLGFPKYSNAPIATKHTHSDRRAAIQKSKKTSHNETDTHTKPKKNGQKKLHEAIRKLSSRLPPSINSSTNAKPSTPKRVASSSSAREARLEARNARKGSHEMVDLSAPDNASFDLTIDNKVVASFDLT